ncbi:MAG: TrmH family RNA methyltransferase [Christensenellales bacterium]
MRGIKEITSKDNAIFKLIKSLKIRKYRIREALFVVEGPKQVVEAETSRYDLKYLVVRQDRLGCLKDYDLFDRVDRYACTVISMDERLFKQISDTENNQGILAVLSYEPLSEKDFMMEVPSGSNVLVLDKLQDPGNIGTIIRTAEGAGFKGIILLKGSGDVFSPKSIRAAGGAMLRMPVTMINDAATLRRLSCEFSKRLIVSDVESGLAYYDVDLSENIFLVMGNEGHGVSKEILDMADIRINIPTDGALESLNVATAGAVLMMDSLRQSKNKIRRGKRC